MPAPGLDASLSAYHLSPLLQAVFGLGLAWLVLRGHGRSRTHVLFALFLLHVALWGVLIFFMRRSPTLEEALFWEKGLVPLAPIMSVFFLYFVARYTFWPIRSWVAALLGTACTLSLPVAFTDLVFRGMRRETFGYTADAGWLFPFWSAFCAALCAAAVFRLVSALRSASGAEERNRLRYVLLGIMAAFLGGILDLLPITGLPSYPGLVTGILVFLVLTAVAILKHNLLDIRRVLREGLAFTLAAVILAAVPIAMVTVSGLLGGAVRLTPVTLLFCLLFSFVLPPLWLRARRLADRWIHGNRLASLEALGRFTREAQALDGPEDPGITMARLFAAAMRSPRAVLFLPDAPGRWFVPRGAPIPAVPAGSGLTKVGSPMALWMAGHGEAVFLRDLQFIPAVQNAVDGESETLQRMEGELVVPLVGGAGRLTGILVVCRRESARPLDLEDRDLASALSREMAVKLDNARLFREALEGRRNMEAWLNGMTECIVITAGDSVRFANRAAVERFGLSAGSRFPIDPQMGSLTLAGRQYDVLSNLLTDPGGAVSTLHVLHDVTEQAERQQEAVRTQKIESLAILSGGIAHDFNNILTAVIGSLDVAMLEAPPPVVKRLTVTRDAAARAVKLTRQLLAFSRGWAPVFQSVPVRKLLEDEARTALEGTRTTASITVAPDTWPVRADEGQLGQAIGNMLRNAAQAMPEGGSVGITAENAVLETGRCVKITITDHGTGIPEKILPQIFDPYFTTRADGGGLGLAVAYAVVKKHRGRIDVASREGVGTTFTTHIPAAGDDGPAPRETAQKPLA